MEEERKAAEKKRLEEERTAAALKVAEEKRIEEEHTAAEKAAAQKSLQSTSVPAVAIVPTTAAASTVVRSAQVNYDEQEVKHLLEVVQGMKIPKHSKNYWEEVANF